jgi:hypothetical protein
LFIHLGARFGSAWRKLENLRFFEIGTGDAISLASAHPGGTKQTRRLTMTNTTYTSRLAAAASAFMLSIVLLTVTATSPSAAHATVYVGEVA